MNVHIINDALQLKWLHKKTELNHRPMPGCCLLIFLSLVLCSNLAAQVKDSAVLLKKVTVKASKKQNTFTTATPVQSLGKETLQEMNATSIGDAARYFSGVLIRDYGGVGGLKTISVRSLGASHTGILYDGIPVSDAQTGQIDLSRFSSTFVEKLELHQANVQQFLLPARAYTAASTLAITTNTYNVINTAPKNWQAGIKSGSFGLWQPFAGIFLPVKNNIVISANAEAVSSRGNYPVYIDNGTLSEKTHRENSQTRSFQGDVNLVKQFADSSTLQTKLWVYTSKRGLPGAIVFFNDRSVQKLWNRDVFIQSRYRKKLNDATALLFAAKYSRMFTRYKDPDFLNNQGGLDDQYSQYEVYLTAALTRSIGNDFIMSAASDLASTKLSANLKNFETPSRLSLWNNIGLNYLRGGWQASGLLLYTHTSDKTVSGKAASQKNELTPTFSVSLKPAPASPFLLRFFYKRIFRMPTFNDLYYNFVGTLSLRPEYANQYNAGITYSKHFGKTVQLFSISADGYFNSVKDKIIAIPNKNLFVWSMLNLGKVHTKGVDITSEANGNISSIGWFCRIAYTWQQALDVTNSSSTTYKNRIPYTPDHSGSGLFSFSFKSWSTGYSGLFSGSRYTLGENSAFNQLEGWITHDVFISHLLKLQPFNISIKGELDNISDERFDVVKYFPMPGRSFKVSLLFNNL